MHRREFLVTPFALALGDVAGQTHQATGVKIGEVTNSSAIVWMRHTTRPFRRSDGILRRGQPRPFPADLKIEDLEGSCAGAPGEVRVRYGTRSDLTGANETDWVEVSGKTDFAHQFQLKGLKPTTEYYYSAETRGPSGLTGHRPLRGRFETAPDPDQVLPITFTMSTCQKYKGLDHPDGYNIYSSISTLAPKFHITAGDIVYYDSDDPRANTRDLARYHWNRMFSFPRHVAMLLKIPGYWEKDDHDTLYNEGWRGQKEAEAMMPMTFDDGLQTFREQVPMGDLTYRTFRWGKCLQIWLVEGRDYRSSGLMPDGPEKTIWGVPQKEWLQRTLLASDADWKILVSPTPIVGPDRPDKADNHSNQAFAHEGNQIRRWIKENMPDNFFNINGDRHWQYHSVHPETRLNEFSVGPASDTHAGGSPGEDSRYHRFHRQLGGFLSVQTGRSGMQSMIRFRLCDVYGRTVYEFKKDRPV